RCPRLPRPFVVRVMSLSRVERRITMTTTTITRRTELARRRSAGIDVYLFWNKPTNRVTVGVIDARTDDGFQFEVDGRHALDAFNHPYAYAARIDTTDRGGLADGPAAWRDAGSNSQEPTINPRSSDHARTDR